MCAGPGTDLHKTEIGGAGKSVPFIRKMTEGGGASGNIFCGDGFRSITVQQVPVRIKAVPEYRDAGRREKFRDAVVWAGMFLHAAEAGTTEMKRRKT